jgi:hypothetical protein
MAPPVASVRPRGDPVDPLPRPRGTTCRRVGGDEPRPPVKDSEAALLPLFSAVDPGPTSLPWFPPPPRARVGPGPARPLTIAVASRYVARRHPPASAKARAGGPALRSLWGLIP